MSTAVGSAPHANALWVHLVLQASPGDRVPIVLDLFGPQQLSAGLAFAASEEAIVEHDDGKPSFGELPGEVVQVHLLDPAEAMRHYDCRHLLSRLDAGRRVVPGGEFQSLAWNRHVTAVELLTMSHSGDECGQHKGGCCQARQPFHPCAHRSLLWG